MLKIWLTWLQPSLGLLGTALVLCYPLYSHAAPKPVVTGNVNKVTTKVPVQASHWSIAKSSGTTIDNELSSAIAATPDMAVRQLAMGSMSPTATPVSKVAPKKTLQSNRAALARFIPPASAKFQNLSAKATKPQTAKNSVAAALARANKIQSPILVPGLFIGTANVQVSSRVLPTAKPLAQAIASSTQIGAPTPLSAMMGTQTAGDPFPVVRPEMMQKLDGNRMTASMPAIQTRQSLDPIAAIPTGKSKAVTSKASAPKAPAYHSLDPIAAIPSGLQRLLGNNLNSEPTVATAPIAKTTATDATAMVALKQFISPTGATVPAPITAASLQLATSQAYASNTPKFSIPGETGLSAKSVKSTTDVLAVQRVRKNLTAATPARKTKYVAILNDRQLTPTPKQPWMLVDRPTNLGGLILGSPSSTTTTKMVGLVPMKTQKNSSSVGLPTRNLMNIN
jgi:hypothetical protein